MLNKIVIMGRLTRDPEMRQTGSGTPVTSFSLAVERDYSGRDGGEKQTDFIDVVAWRHTAEFVDKYFSKGDMAAVSGRLQIRDWTDKDGNKRRSAEVVADSVYFGGSKRREADAAPAAYDSRPAAAQPTEADMERLDELVSAYDNVAYADDTDGGDLPF